MKTFIGMLIMMTVMVGCASDGALDKAKAEEVAGKVIEIGMTVQEVVDLLGAPDSVSPSMRAVTASPDVFMNYGDTVITTSDSRVTKIERLR